MLGGFGNMSSLLSMAMTMGPKIQAVRSELQEKRFTGTDDEQKVSVTANGLTEVQDVSVDASLLSPECKEVLEAKLKGAISELSAQLCEEYKRRMADAGKEIGIPGLANLLR
ncbi:MAG: YbaB/EbfC family nucleoid-associated protein [Planctomycetia bacterium]|nr:YbaB/EbfC family nucleoid-associated protein [Planctomycetia bacterium]